MLVVLFLILTLNITFPIFAIHVGKEWVGGDGDKAMPQILMTPDFGPVTIASFADAGSGVIGIGKHGKWFKVKTSSCALDGMRIRSDFAINTFLATGHTNISSPTTLGGKCDGLDGVDEETDVFIELDDNDMLGIRINMRRCLTNDLGGIMMEHNVRIEDQSGWLIEKFFFKILQNVDMHAIMNEEKRRKGKQLRWICVPDDDVVTMDAGFSLLGLTTNVQPNLHASLSANWNGSSEDGMIVTTNVTADYGNCGSNGHQNSSNYEDDDSTAQVNISLDDEREWTLSVQINECINTTGKFDSEWFASKPMRFTAKMDISEGSIYSRLLVVARQYVKKKNLKSDKLKELLAEM